MPLRLHFFIVLCLSAATVAAEDSGDSKASAGELKNITELTGQASPQQEDARRQVRSEGEDPQAEKTSIRQKEAEHPAEQQKIPRQEPALDEGLEQAREETRSEEDEPQFKREADVSGEIVEAPFKGDVYGSVRLHFRSTDEGTILGDSGSRLGAEAEWRTRSDSWFYARVEAGFNLLDEVDQLLNPGGGAGEGKQGDSLFARLYNVGIETPVVVASYGKSWSTYYRIGNFTDRFDSTGSSAIGMFNANTDGGATGTGRADSVLQTRAFIDFLPERWGVKPFNLNIQLQSDQPVPRVQGVNYENAIGVSAVLESREDYTFGVAYNRARIGDLDDAAVKAAGIVGDAQAYLIGARWFNEQWYLGFTLARLKNQDTTDQGTYFLGWGSELYTRYKLIKGYWLVAGYNWLEPDSDQIQVGDYKIQYGVVGLRYSIDDFNRLVFAEWRLDGSVSEDGTQLGNIFTLGVRWDF